MICPHCRYSLDDGVAFCIYCGHRLGKFAETTDAGAGAAQAGTSAAAGVAGVAAAGAAAAEAVGAEAAGAAVVEGAADAGAPTETFAGDPAPDSAFDLVGDYPDQADFSGADATGAAADAANLAAPAAAAGSAAGQTQRLHSEDSFSQRMEKVPQREEKKSRKGLGAVIVGLLLVAGIAVGGLYVLPNVVAPDGSSSSTEQGDGGSSSSTESGSSASGSSSSSKSSSSSSESDDNKPETRYGSTLSKATSGDEGSGEGAAGAVSGDSGEGASSGDSGSGYYYYDGGTSGGSYPVFAPSGATATSISPTEGSTPHGPDLVIDGITTTAWNTNMSGVGESITITTGQLSTLNGLRIMGGYNKISYSGADLYYANARPKEILIEYEGGSTTYTMADKKGEYQDIAINPPAATTWIKITIRSVYPGDLYDDCCISEIQMY